MLTASILVLTATAIPAHSAGSACHTAKFYETDDGWFKAQTTPAAIGWTSSGVRHGENLLVVDVLEKHLVELTEDGKILSTITTLQSPTGNTVELDEPSLLYPRLGGGFLLLDDAVDQPGRILAVTSDLTVQKTMQVEDRKVGDVLITGVFKIVELGDGALMFADFQDPAVDLGDPKKYWSGFVYLSFDGDYLFFGDPVPLELKDYFLRDFSPMASTGPNDAYVLMFDPEASWIAHVSMEEGTMGRLAALPADFARAPKLERVPEWIGDRTKTDRQLYLFYELFQTSQMPTSLVADDSGGLHLVAKGAIDTDQRTSWWWVSLSPVTGEEVSRSRLPTHAAQIVAPILGDRRTTVIEKGPIGLKNQKIFTTFRETNSMVVFPDSWLDRHDFEKVGGHAVFDCKRLPPGKG